MRFVKNRTVAIDGGAHYGSWTRYMAKDFEKVYSFEPHQRIFECLEKNTEHLPNVERVPCALGDKPDWIDMADGDDNSGCGYVNGEGEIPVVTIDGYNLDND
jgi:FkbM family methyltransferase